MTPCTSWPHTTVRAAGMPLQDGELTPGTLTVRVVREAFSENLAGQTVTLEIDGGEPRSASTGGDGRALFAHLPIGARVRARADVAGERLESESFPMPAEAGVRVLFVAPDGKVRGVDAAPPRPAAAAHTPVESRRPAESGAPVSDLTVVRAVMSAIALGVFAFVLGRRLTPRRYDEGRLTGTRPAPADSERV
jgi:hypothetical protein